MDAPSDAPGPDAPGPDGSGLARIVEGVERTLLGGPRRYTRADMARESGLDPEAIRSLWRALGFAAVGDDERAFTDADVAALADVGRIESVAEIDDEMLRAMTRIIGQTFARLASWQGQLVFEIVARSPELLAEGDGSRVLELVDRLMPVVGELHNYVWRRQLAAYFSRITSSAGAGTATAVGFADMAEFTAFTRRSSEAELRAVLGRFETLATDVVAACRGQIVKTIGDEVLFVADDPGAGAEIALRLVEAAAADALLPPLCAGIAFGPVVSRLGDVYGQTVNIASRLTSVARPGSVLVDEGMSGALTDDARFTLRALRPTAVRGYHHLRPWRLRRVDADR